MPPPEEEPPPLLLPPFLPEVRAYPAIPASIKGAAPNSSTVPLAISPPNPKAPAAPNFKVPLTPLPSKEPAFFNIPGLLLGVFLTFSTIGLVFFGSEVG